MDREVFKKQMEAPLIKECSKEELLKILNTSILSTLKDGNPIGHRQLIIVTEELAELTQEITKELRGKGDKNGILEEMADVAICLEYLKLICFIEQKDLEKAINIKLSEIDRKLNAGLYK